MEQKINAYQGLREHLKKETTWKNEVDRAKGQAVSRRPLIAKNGIKSRTSQRGKYGGQTGSGTGFSIKISLSLVSLCKCYILFH